MPVRVPGSADDELGALARRGKDRGVLILHQLRLALGGPVPDEGHRPQDGLLVFIRGQGLQPLLGGKLNIDAEPVRQQAQLLHQLRGRAGDGFGVDISVEPVFLPQQAQTLDHLFGGVVGAAQDAGGQEQALDIIAPVEPDGQLRQLPGGEGRPAGIVGPAVDAVFAVVDATVGHQHLQQGDAAPVGREAVAAACQGGAGVADHARPGAPANAAGGAGRVIFGRIGQDGQLIQQFHDRRPQAVRRRGRGWSIQSARRITPAEKAPAPSSITINPKVVIGNASKTFVLSVL